MGEGESVPSVQASAEDESLRCVSRRSVRAPISHAAAGCATNLSGNTLRPHFNALLLLASSSSRDTALTTSVTPKTTSDMFDPGSVPQ